MKRCVFLLIWVLLSCQKPDSAEGGRDSNLQLELVLPLEVSRSAYRVEQLRSLSSHIQVILEFPEGKRREWVFPPDRWSEIWVSLSELDKNAKGKIWISVDLFSATVKPVVLFKGRKGATLEEALQKVTLHLHPQMPLNEIFKP